MKIRVPAALLMALVISGCANTPDEEGWRSSQKKEFLEMLKEDRYASVCEQQPLYEKVKQTENSRLMSKLLVEYTENLANGCIDLQKFREVQAAKKKRKIESHYDLYLQKVDSTRILAQIKAGQTVENILKPYLPATEQFPKLVKTYHALQDNESVTPEQLRILRLNIERTKIMRSDLGEDYALVNIPEFMVRIKKGEQTALKSAVIVGQKDLQTPVFAEPMQYITLNPQWGVPDSIARNEIIPKVLKDPAYLARNNMVIRRDYNLDSQNVSLSDVNLAAYRGGRGAVPFKFIERPSERNVLGRIKFIFPNSHAVYMHDTQGKSLFKREVRTFSHGCVRVEKPNEMLIYIASNFTAETPESIMEKYESLKTHHIPLKKRMMVHTAYLTSYVDSNGTVLMFNDIYGFDRDQVLNFQ
ncbi:L,D-transpeptidase family protein [Sulfurovum sp.]|jgi:murein L,D-transpeptidase YcbB/YkuD|uniref:L,D-transpeptidase family protein n=1 Tax=Sulfurovum sp. TaxID=1969726 RepID=UPI002A359E71|nr:L,D-transpeptidase family protein [Sulfurovum sp.]MDD2451751.1 L,D-transpeptidase family protein [Sulfurovum sp.]MDD3500291.1 L,D-transpeptidase family protein [Sulfurovum sp.]MDY0401970.1 L,D-transpeptidase family protein [Sulfurovum sp.]